MLLFANQITPRLQHTANWLGVYLFGKPLRITTDAKAVAEQDVVFNYSPQSVPVATFQFQPHPLLFENTIVPQIIQLKEVNQTPCFFETAGNFPFDVLAASFYLLQRYEEYLPHQKDAYGRYAHTNSLAFQADFLHLPVVDLWMLQLKQALHSMFPQLRFTNRQFQFIPAYDVDIAFSYRGKGLLRNLWGVYRSLATGRMGDFLQRMDFALAGKKDPFDVFDELDELHQQHHLQPIYFLLLAQKQKGIDKNISPGKKVYRNLIEKLSKQYKTGIHFSGAAAESFTTKQTEKKILEEITGEATIRNRMHYLLAFLPETYQQLLQPPLNITADYTMGYSTVNGFRASICTPYYWYDLSKEAGTNLQIFPFCYMDATSIFEEETTPAGALQEMKGLLQTVQQVNGVFISIFHNHFMGLDAEGRKWMQMYKQFLSFTDKSIFTSD